MCRLASGPGRVFQALARILRGICRKLFTIMKLVRAHSEPATLSRFLTARSPR